MSLAPAFFITGTDTGVGKTWVTTQLIRMLRESGLDVVGMKPIECGGWEDGEALAEASSHQLAGRKVPKLKREHIAPLGLPDPVAPAAAPSYEEIDFRSMSWPLKQLRERHECVLVEGAGGWFLPIDEERTLADWVKTEGLPVITIVLNRLGALSHTLLTWEAIKRAGLPRHATFLNSPAPASDLAAMTNLAVLESRRDSGPVFGDLQELADSIKVSVASASA